MNEVYLLIGGNIGNRLNYLEKACELIEQHAGKIIVQSSVYKTAAWGMENQAPFLNQVLKVETECVAKDLLYNILAIEEKLGRKRAEKYGPRTIDIDILFFNNDIINEKDLKVPHPALPDRRFALMPLFEIAPQLKHPFLGKTVEELLAICPDQLPVEKFIG